MTAGVNHQVLSVEKPVTVTRPMDKLASTVVTVPDEEATAVASTA